MFKNRKPLFWVLIGAAAAVCGIGIFLLVKALKK